LAALVLVLFPDPELEPEPELDPDEEPELLVDVAAGAEDDVAAVPFSLSALRTNPSMGCRVAETLPALMTPTPPMPQVFSS